MNKLRIKHPIILSSSPIIAPLIGSLNETSAHYFCLDDNTLFEAAFASIGALEKALIEKADSSFFVSDALLNKLSSKGNRSFYLPQGVEIEHFKPSNGPLPASVALIKKPVVGFFGLLSSWVDYQLIVRCAREYPDASFVIIGKSTVNLSLFSSVPNIVYLGEIEYDVLPQYVNMFDVGLIPFVLNELTLAANPLKFLEYMAMGIPVVSTNLPEVAKFQNNAFVATNDNDFLRLIQRALNDNSPEARHRRRSVASHFSWDIVVDRVSDVIAAIEAEKEMRQENIR